MQAEGPSSSPKAESKDNGKKISHPQKKSSISEDKKITSIYSDEEGDEEDNNEDDGDGEEEEEDISEQPIHRSDPKVQANSSNRKAEVQKILSTLPSSNRTVDYDR
jgi:hypothetical protein